MPVDTASKRASSAQMLLFHLNSPPLPTGVLGQLVRQHIVHTYSGIVAVFSGVANILRQMLMQH
jgi:hypothetical protein